MSTPKEILDAVYATVEIALRDPSAKGRPILVFDGKFPGQLASMLLTTDSAIEALTKADAPAEVVEQFRTIPASKVGVIYRVGEHFGTLAYEPVWSVS